LDYNLIIGKEGAISKKARIFWNSFFAGKLED
jgi:hypothetical protein